MFNQVNCALYRDSTLWFVPGSHAQPDLPGQIQTSYTDRCPTKEAEQSEEAFEQICLDHCRSFPGDPIQVHLEPGDYLVYRNAAWHCAYMVTHQPRATLHHIPTVPGKSQAQVRLAGDPQACAGACDRTLTPGAQGPCSMTKCVMFRYDDIARRGARGDPLDRLPEHGSGSTTDRCKP